MSSLLVLWLVGAAPAVESLAQVQSRELAAALDDLKQDKEDACFRLDEALTYFWGPWTPEERVEWPRVWRTQIPDSLDTWKAAADACAAQRAATEWGLVGLVHSGLLRSDELYARSLASAIAHEGVNVTADGGVQYFPPQSFSRSLERASDPTTAGLRRLTGTWLGPEIALKVIRHNRVTVMYCYERYADPPLSGEMVVRFTLAPDRDTATVELEKTTVGNSRLEACVMNRTSRWTWPRPKKGEVVITYAFHFKPGRDAP